MRRHRHQDEWDVRENGGADSYDRRWEGFEEGQLEDEEQVQTGDNYILRNQVGMELCKCADAQQLNTSRIG